MTEREADTEIMMTLSEQSWELARVFIEASKIFIFIFLFDQADSEFNNLRRVFIKYIFKFIAVKTYSYQDPVSFKGQCQETFCFRFLPWIIFPQAPEKNITGILNFFENLWRYLQVKVRYRYQWHQRQILLLVLLVSLIPEANFPMQSMTPVANNGKKYQTADILKWTCRKTIIYMLILLHKGVPKK